MKDGTTHLAHKAEHAVDLGEDAHGSVLAVNVADVCCAAAASSWSDRSRIDTRPACFAAFTCGEEPTSPSVCWSTRPGSTWAC